MTPENEMGVVVLFSQQIMGLPIELVSIGAEFPDSMIKGTTCGIIVNHSSEL